MLRWTCTNTKNDLQIKHATLPEDSREHREDIYNSLIKRLRIKGESGHAFIT